MEKGWDRPDRKINPEDDVIVFGGSVEEDRHYYKIDWKSSDGFDLPVYVDGFHLNGSGMISKS